MLTQKTKKVFSILIAFALIFGVSATNVWAAPGEVLDPAKPVSLTLQKSLTAEPSTTPGDGATGPDLSADLKPAANVEFRLTKLMNVDGDTSLNSYEKDDTKIYKGKTNGVGQIIWSTGTHGLEQGFYLLEETSSPYNGTVSAENPQGVMANKAAPSIIALPYANATGYNYDVKVFPKNVGDINIKTVLNPDNVYKPGDVVQWDIQTVINGETVETYSITDTLDYRLKYEDVAMAMILPGLATSINLTQGTDYTVKPLVIKDIKGNSAYEVTIALTDMGIEKVRDNKAIAISTVVKTTINPYAFVAGDDDVILNNADLNFTTDICEGTVSIPESASITLARVELTKVNSDGDLLEGAQFKIAATEADALAGVFMKNAAGQELIITTDGDGKASASGLPYVESEVTRETDTNKVESINVYLVETQAPAGYDLLQREVVGEGLQSIVAKATLEGGASRTINDAMNRNITYTVFTGGVTVTNYKAFTLPITGGAGTIIFTVVGLVMILGAAFVLLKTRKKKRPHKTA